MQKVEVSKTDNGFLKKPTLIQALRVMSWFCSIFMLVWALTDPRFKDSFWKGEIKLQMKMGKKSEQQALAKYGLDYVTDTYLPEKLSEMGIIKK